MIRRPPTPPEGPQAAAQQGEPDGCATLRRVYEGLRSERDRLRDARSSYSRQLGPLPVVAGISTGTIAVFAHHVRTSWLLWVALGLLVLLVVVSVLYSSIPAYRQIRARLEQYLRARCPHAQFASEVAALRNEPPAGARRRASRAVHRAVPLPRDDHLARAQRTDRLSGGFVVA